MPACHGTHVWKVFCQRNRIPLIKHNAEDTQLNSTLIQGFQVRKSRTLVTFGQTTDSQDQGVEQNLYKDVNMLSQLLGSGTTRIAVSLQQGLILIVEQG